MKTLSVAVLILNFIAVVPARADQSAGADAQIAVVLQALVVAQAAFDATQLDQLLAPDYIEISPVGEVDPRAKVLGAQRQLLLPVSDNYSCRFRVSK